MTEIKYSRDAFRDQLHELSGQPNICLFLDVILKGCLIKLIVHVKYYM